MELTRTEIEEQIQNIELILHLYDSLIRFLYKYEDDYINIFSSKGKIDNLIDDFEDILQEIKAEFELI